MSETKATYDARPETNSKPTQIDVTSGNTYMVDRVMAQVTVAVMRDGRKVGEVPFQATPLFYPFDLADLIHRSEEKAKEQCEGGRG